MNLTEHFGDPGAPCLSCGCPYSWITGKVQVMTLCCRCYPRRDIPADMWAELKRAYSARRIETLHTARTYESRFDERNLHGRGSRRQQSDDSSPLTLWEQAE